MLAARLARRNSAVLTLTLALFGATGCSSSRGTREPWVYAISRGAYDSMSDSADSIEPPAEERSQESFAMIMAIVLVLPFAVDTLLLPITLPHDLLFVD